VCSLQHEMVGGYTIVLAHWLHDDTHYNTNIRVFVFVSYSVCVCVAPRTLLRGPPRSSALVAEVVDWIVVGPRPPSVLTIQSTVFPKEAECSPVPALLKGRN